MISVCMATYNGSKYIREQVDSILTQLGADDELIVSDDGSTDNTIEILKSYGDSRIKIFNNTNRGGVVGNFENALTRAVGEYIFLSDQDDIWESHRVTKVMAVLSSSSELWLTLNNYNVFYMNSELPSQIRYSESTDPLSKNFLGQLKKNPYIGCCMAFKRELLDIALPFPTNLAMHDSWIGLLAKLHSNRVQFISEPLLRYRRHEQTVTKGKSPYSIWFRIKYRITLCYNLLTRLYGKK